MIEVEKFVKNTGTFYYIKGTKTSHREDGPAVILSSGSLFWYKHGMIHRVDGPAIENITGTKVWYANGSIHRESGPAIIHPDGTVDWYIHGDLFDNKEEWFESLSEDQKIKAIYSEHFIGS